MWNYDEGIYNIKDLKDLKLSTLYNWRLIMMSLTIAYATLLVTTQTTLTPTYNDLVHEATYYCKNADPEKVDTSILWDLVKVEKKYNVPPSHRGMILAASCSESGHDPNAKGDYRIIKNKRLPMALGILQQWPWYEKRYGIDRTNHVQAADSWMRHIHKRVYSVGKACKIKNISRMWTAAWVTAIRYPKPGGRCNEKPLHLRILKKWHKDIRESYEKEDGC